jgi:hypothetical protein
MPSVEERQGKVLSVVAAHDRARTDVEAKVLASRSLVEVDALLKPAMVFWGLSGDVEWAMGLLSAATARLGGATGPVVKLPTPPAPGSTSPPAPVIATPATSAGQDRVIQLDGQINQALATNNQSLALQNIALLDPAASELPAIKRKFAIWSRRGDIIGKVIVDRAPTLRVHHPTTMELWDIVSASNAGLSISSPSGSKTDLIWSQVSTKDLARVCSEMASNPAAKSDEHQLATVMLLLNGDTVLASVQVKKGKGVIEPDAMADLETLIGLQRRRDALELVVHANEAARQGNGKQLAECLDQLKKLDKSLQPLVAADIARLEELRKTSGPVGTLESPSASKDHLTFTSTEDLKYFSERSGSWQSVNGQLANAGEGCRLVRKDMHDARSMHLIFQSLNQRGAMIVEFRGVRLVIDFAANTYQAISREETLKPRPFTFLAKTANSLYFELKQPNNFLSIEVNNGADSMGLKAGDLTDNFAIALDLAWRTGGQPQGQAGGDAQPRPRWSGRRLPRAAADRPAGGRRRAQRGGDAAEGQRGGRHLRGQGRRQPAHPAGQSQRPQRPVDRRADRQRRLVLQGHLECQHPGGHRWRRQCGRQRGADGWP